MYLTQENAVDLHRVGWVSMTIGRKNIDSLKTWDFITAWRSLFFRL